MKRFPDASHFQDTRLNNSAAADGLHVFAVSSFAPSAATRHQRLRRVSDRHVEGRQGGFEEEFSIRESRGGRHHVSDLMKSGGYYRPRFIPIELILV